MFRNLSLGFVFIINEPKNMTEKEDKYRNIETLLPRFCEGMTTEEETQLVEKWIEENKANQKIVDQIHALYLAADTLHVIQSVDTEKVLKKVKTKLNRKKISWWEWTQRVAVILFIPLLIGILLMYMDRQEHQEIARMLEVKTNPGMTTSIMLPDSTIVYLNSESTLRYPSSFNADIRKVELIGEAFFDVTKDAQKCFVISTLNHSQIEVYGTSFNVEAYVKDNQLSATLVNGKISFLFNDKAGIARKINLQPNQKLIYQPAAGEAKVYQTSCESETAWKEGKIIFNNTSMEDILRTLSKRYNVEFVVKNKSLKEYAFTGSFTSQRLERIMEFFKVSSKINWRYLDSDEITDEKQRIEIY